MPAPARAGNRAQRPSSTPHGVPAPAAGADDCPRRTASSDGSGDGDGDGDGEGSYGGGGGGWALAGTSGRESRRGTDGYRHSNGVGGAGGKDPAGAARSRFRRPPSAPRLGLGRRRESLGPGSGSRSEPGSGPGPGPEPLSYSQRVARLRKPALTAADKLSLSPEERARIYRELRTPRRPRGAAPPGSQQHPTQPHPHPHPPRLRVFCYGIDDVRLYKAAEGAGLLGSLTVVPEVARGDAVLATRSKRTGRAVELKEVAAAARNAGKPFVELPALSPVRLAEAVEALTGWPVPAHLRVRPPRGPRGPQGEEEVSFLPPLERDGSGSAAALLRLTGGLSLHDYIASKPDFAPPEDVLRELDVADLYEGRDELLAGNPKEREAARARPLARPHMAGSRRARKRMLEEQARRAAEAAGEVHW